jgi:SAM-dependent methyltransferase
MRGGIRQIVIGACVAAFALLSWTVGPTAQDTTFEPTVGQAGKDVVWVPTSPELLDRMLDMANVGPADLVVDLGSGDGRNIIAAAKRGARARGVEYNPDMVALSKRLAQEAGVGDKATFVEGDMYEADISDATVLALFLLPQNLDKLADKFLALAPGSRIVVNTFGITGWTPVRTERLEVGCVSWCTAMLYLVPARVQGTWGLGDGELTIAQDAQTITGTLTVNGVTSPITEAKVEGTQITFQAGDASYLGEVNGREMSGTVIRHNAKAAWTATRRP